MATSNEVQVADKVVDHLVLMNQTVISSANSILSGFNKLKALTDIPNKKTILEAGLISKGLTLTDIQSNMINLKNVADYIKSNVSEMTKL